MPRVLPLDPATYSRHALHAEERLWVEKNCYVDVWIEVLHALGVDPMAMLPFVVGVDFEGDQLTFFKPPHGELRELYGIDVQELNVWRPLAEHVAEHVGGGKMVMAEADAYYLPDTSGTDYRTTHTKTTVVFQDIDTERGRVGYFHNSAYHWLEGEDYARVFQVGEGSDPARLPFFAELVKVDRLVRRSPEELARLSRGLLARHLAYRPAKNPIARLRDALPEWLAKMHAQPLAYYHAWAFANLRQLGAAAELAALYFTWLGERETGRAAALAPVSQAFEANSAATKTLILKMARAANGKKPFDAKAAFDDMASRWDQAMEALQGAVGDS